MGKLLLCWMFDHDPMKTSSRHWVWLRRARRETARNLGHVLAWRGDDGGASRLASVIGP
jgi:hypothetical protein